MDLVAGVRKEGSRGGRDSFKWSDVKESSHRENYLGHSIMAPVGRWQQNRDLNWYAKSGDDDSADKAKQEREEEIRRIKEAEQDAMALALGLPVAPRASNNANMTPLGGQEVRKAVQESTEGDGDADGGRGIGFGSYGGIAGNDAEDEILAPIGMDSGVRPLGQEKDGRDRDSRGHRSRRDRSRDPDRRRDREHRDRDRGGRHRHDRADRERRHRHHRELRDNRRRQRSRSRSVSRSPRPERRERRQDESDRRRDAGRSGRHRSSSPRRDRADRESGRDAHYRHHRK